MLRTGLLDVWHVEESQKRGAGTLKSRADICITPVI